MKKSKIKVKRYIASRIDSMKTSGVPFLENIEYED